ncbi:hypothetical protein [Chryseobacterium sp. MP_3.2]|uniref:hypothetical protein n=1 Tax=Chryseobacterium sp. MP_3.2 TaxID=3071712 RepID=UPI002DFCF8E0|nr:hypothetical protein [Chryseobacterium sp. MP_3.2]
MANLNFNDHLDDMMERLMDEKITPESLELELKRSKALCQIATIKIEDKKVTVMALEAIGDLTFEKNNLPENIKKILQIENS